MTFRKWTRTGNEIARQDEYRRKIASFDQESQNIAQEDQALHFEEAFRDRALENGVSIQSVSRPSIRSDDYTMEQQVTLQLNANEKNLVDFLYSLGSGGSMIRAKSISMRPMDNNRYQLHADLTISESYLRNPSKPTPRTGAAPTTPAAPAKPAAPAAPTSAPGRLRQSLAAKSEIGTLETINYRENYIVDPVLIVSGAVGPDARHQ